jgi:hypothetical protein
VSVSTFLSLTLVLERKFSQSSSYPWLREFEKILLHFCAVSSVTKRTPGFMRPVAHMTWRGASLRIRVQNDEYKTGVRMAIYLK